MQAESGIMSMLLMFLVPLSCGAPQVATQSPASPGTKIECPSGMVFVSGGVYKNPNGRMTTVADFCMDTHEVTVEQYAACVAAGKCSANHMDEIFVDPTKAVLKQDACNYDKPDRGKHPINCVSWNQAVAFCKAYDRRLPHLEEQDWVIRGGARGTLYPWGNSPPMDQLCWDGEGNDLGKGKRRGTCPVGSFPRDSLLGIHDVAGNVSEWDSADFEGFTVCYTHGGAWSDVDPSRVGAGKSESIFGRDGHHVAIGFRCARNP